VRIGLREITQKTFGFKIDILAEETKVIAIGEKLIK